MSAKKALIELQSIIDDNAGDSDKTIKRLHSEKPAHLSYSMISSYEYCPRKYYLEYAQKKVDAYYDQYRWVKNLARIRKPAFSRNKISTGPSEFGKAVTRAKRAYRGMCELSEPVKPSFDERCYPCQFRGICG